MKKKTIVTILLSILATIGIVLETSIGNNINYNNIFVIILFSLFLYFFSLMKKPPKKDFVFLTILSAIISILVILGDELEYTGDVEWTLPTLIKTLLLGISVFPMVSLIKNGITKISLSIKPLKIKNKTVLFLIIFSVVFFFDFLVWLAMYPGLYGYDAGYEILEIIGNIQMTSHFSILYTIILGNLVKFGMIWFGDYHIGFAIYSFLQMLFLSYVASKICYYVYIKSSKKWLLVTSIILFSLFPPFTILNVSACQDPLFSGLFCLVLLNFVNIAEDNRFLENKKNVALLPIEILLLCLLRNNGFYAMLVPVAYIVFKIIKDKTYIKLMLIVVIPLIIYKIIVGPVYKMLDIKKANSLSEMLSIPSQQLARVYAYNRDAFNESDIEELNKFYDMNNFKYYTVRQSVADPIKSSFHVDYLENNFSDYLRLWVRIGFRDKKDYIEAFLFNSIGFWYPNKIYYDERMYQPYLEYEMLDAKKWNKDYIVINRQSKFRAYDNILNEIINNNAWVEIPFVPMLFEMGSYFILFVFLLLYTIINKKLNLVLPISLIFGLYATLLLAPLALFRYALPVFMSSPIMIYMIILQENTEKVLEKNSKNKRRKNKYEKNSSINTLL